MNLFSLRSGGRIRYSETVSQMTGEGEEWLVEFKRVDGQVVFDEKGNPIVEEARAVFLEGRMTTDHLNPTKASKEAGEAETLIAA